MKKILMFGLALSLAAFGCGGENAEGDHADHSPEGEAQEVKMAGFVDVEISVPTIQCGSCASKVKEGLEMVDGVEKIEVDEEAKIAKVSFDKAKTNLAALEQAIAAEGYDANETKRDMEAYGELDSCCQIPEEGEDNEH